MTHRGMNPRGVLFVTLIVVFAALWNANLAETDYEWLADFKNDIDRTKPRYWQKKNIYNK